MLVFVVDGSICVSFVGIACVVNKVVVDSRVSSGIVLRVGSAIFREIGASSAIASLSDSVSDFECASELHVKNQDVETYQYTLLPPHLMLFLIIIRK